MSGAARTTPNAESGRAKAPFRARFKAWWEGYELESEPEATKAADDRASKPAKNEPEPFVRNGPAHIELMQAVWGEGHTMPGGDARVLQLVKPFGLNPAMSVLDIGAGLGGTGRAICNTFGVWVTGMEREEVLVKAGNEMSKMAGLSRKVQIETTNLEEVEIKQRGFDCVFSKEQLFLIEDKARLIPQIDEALKDNGQVLFTDFLATGEGGTGFTLEEWAAEEPEPVFPWTLEQYLDALRACEVDIRISEDVTDAYRRTITQGWAEFMTAQRDKPYDPRLSSAMVQEVELWTRRAQALESGALQVYRFYAIRKGVSKMLSDW